jgi:NADH-quinone oxidoreductase subunit A
MESRIVADIMAHPDRNREVARSPSPTSSLRSGRGEVRLGFSYTPLWFVVGFAIVIPVAFVLLSTRLGPRRPNPVKREPYESGIIPMPQAERKFQVRFYLVAVSFLLFDVEIVFLFPWAVRFRQLGWFGFGSMLIFLAILVLGLIYEWRKGALEWR